MSELRITLNFDALGVGQVAQYHSAQFPPLPRLFAYQIDSIENQLVFETPAGLTWLENNINEVAIYSGQHSAKIYADDRAMVARPVYFVEEYSPLAVPFRDEPLTNRHLTIYTDIEKTNAANLLRCYLLIRYSEVELSLKEWVRLQM
jgi:hypothetical protein